MFASQDSPLKHAHSLEQEGVKYKLMLLDVVLGAARPASCPCPVNICAAHIIGSSTVAHTQCSDASWRTY